MTHAEYMREYRRNPVNAAKHRKCSRRWLEKNREKNRQWQRENRQKNLQKARAYDRARYPKRTQKNREWQLQTRYGISVEEFDRIMSRQKHCCGICREPFSSTKHRHVDHCHVRNVVRGILCNKCNLAVGLLRNSPTIALEAAHYLNQS